MEQEIKKVKNLKIAHVSGEIIIHCPHCNKKVMRIKMENRKAEARKR